MREYLIRYLSVSEAYIRVQSSENKELAHEDLLSEHRSVRWILTKDALKEGWDRSFEVLAAKEERILQGAHASPIQRSLFEPLFESGFNGLEKDFALYLERSNAIYWWHRIAARQDYHLQGWRRQRVYPDFVACRKDDGKLLILETKGIHLKGSDDTGDKKNLLAILEDAYSAASERGQMRIGKPPATFRMMFEEKWPGQVSELLNGTYRKPL